MTEETLDLLYIYKDNCGPCDSMYPILESLSNKRPDINLYKFDFNDNDQFVENIKLQLGVIGTPFFAAFKNNSVNKTVLGARTIEELEGLFDFVPATTIDIKNKTID
jgi:thiol-disulfide isomerase/thioredoxin